MNCLECDNCMLCGTGCIVARFLIYLSVYIWQECGTIARLIID